MCSVATVTDSPEVQFPVLDPAAVTPLMVSEYRLWFLNTTAWYQQSSFLLPADDNFPWTRVMVPVTADHVHSHLIGKLTLGLYALNAETNCCKWFAIDGDYAGADEHLTAIADEMRNDGLAPALEDSRRGAHLWLLCDEPLPGSLGRVYLYNLLDQLGYAIRGARGNREGLEIFPRQESLEPGAFGNGLRGPLGIHRKVRKRFWFRGATPEMGCQFAYLRNLPRLTRAQLEGLTAGIEMPADLIERDEPAPIQAAAHGAEFDIRLYVETPRRRGRKYHVQCPSCAEAGRDTGKNNLHLSEVGGRPPLYHCFAGCSGAEVRAACHRRAGRPATSQHGGR
jgi:hypothetical protein